MKNFIKLFAVCSALAFATVGCGKDGVAETNNCLSFSENISTALTTYVSDPTIANCNAYLDALRRYLDDGACFGDVLHEQYREALADLQDTECQ